MSVELAAHLQKSEPQAFRTRYGLANDRLDIIDVPFETRHLRNMKIPLDSLAVPQEHFNAWSLLVSCLALLVAVAAVFANGVPNWMKSQKISVYPDKGFLLNQYVGTFSTVMTATVINGGGSDVGLNEMTLDLAFENGNKLRLVGDSWSKQENASYASGAVTSYVAGEYRMSDVVVRPGQSWTGIVRLSEKIANERSEAVEDFHTAMYKEQRKKLSAYEEAKKNMFKGLMTLLATGKEKKPDTSVNLDFLDSSGLTNECAAPTATLVEKGRDLTATALQRIGKGKHMANLKLVADGQPVFDASYDFVLFERELRTFRESESLVSSICVSSNSGGLSAYSLSPTSSVRIGLTPQAKK